jgi:hypothetical protein
MTKIIPVHFRGMFEVITTLSISRTDLEDGLSSFFDNHISGPHFDVYSVSFGLFNR